MRHLKLLSVLTAAIALCPTLALAHPGHGGVYDAMHGFMHPIGGLDHVLAMVAVGIFAAQLGGRALWLVPASFVVSMAAAGALGMTGVPMPFIEIGIAVSVIALGAAIALQLDLPVAAAMAVVAVFAVFHGYAHGLEMPADRSGLAYGAGFVAATALLHAVGVGIGLVIARAGLAHGRLAQAGGSAIALAGVLILTRVV